MQRFHPDSANQTKWFRDKRMHSSTFLPFTQRGWKENESREISCFNETTPRFIDVLLPLLPFLLLLLFPVLIVLTRSSLNALFFPSKKKNRWEWSSEEKKRKEGKRRKNGDIPSTSFLLFISLYIYISQRKNCTCFDKEEKKSITSTEIRNLIIEDFIESVECFLKEW